MTGSLSPRSRRLSSREGGNSFMNGDVLEELSEEEVRPVEYPQVRVCVCQCAHLWE